MLLNFENPIHQAMNLFSSYEATGFFKSTIVVTIKSLKVVELKIAEPIKKPQSISKEQY